MKRQGKKREGHFWRKEWEDSLFDLNQWGRAGGQRRQMIRPEHQIFNDPDHQTPERGFSRPPCRQNRSWTFLSDSKYWLSGAHWRAAMGSFIWGFVTDFFTYETTKSVVVKSWSVGIINRIVQLLIITYFVGSVLVFVIVPKPIVFFFFVLMWFWSLPFVRFECVSFFFLAHKNGSF